MHVQHGLPLPYLVVPRVVVKIDTNTITHTTSIIVLAVAPPQQQYFLTLVLQQPVQAITIAPSSTWYYVLQQAGGHESRTTSIAPPVHCFLFFESVKMAANTVPKPPCTHHRDNLSYWRIFEWKNKYTVWTHKSSNWDAIAYLYQVVQHIVAYFFCVYLLCLSEEGTDSLRRGPHISNFKQIINSTQWSNMYIKNICATMIFKAKT